MVESYYFRVTKPLIERRKAYMRRTKAWVRRVIISKRFKRTLEEVRNESKEVREVWRRRREQQVRDEEEAIQAYIGRTKIEKLTKEMHLLWERDIYTCPKCGDYLAQPNGLCLNCKK